MERDLALALLKRLRERGVIGEQTYLSACGSRFLDGKYASALSARKEGAGE